jgi:hypothetical protein
LGSQDATSGALAFRVGDAARTAFDVLDSRGRTMFSVHRRPFHLHTTYEGRAPISDEVLFTLKAALSAGTKLSMYVFIIIILPGSRIGRSLL